ILTERGRVVGVETLRGRVEAPVVVLVPGAWAAPLLAPLGLDFGLVPHRIQITIFRWPAGFTSRHCVVIDAIHQSWFSPEGAATTLIGVGLCAGPADPNAFDEAVDPEFVSTCRTALAGRLRAMRQPIMRGGRAART